MRVEHKTYEKVSCQLAVATTQYDLAQDSVPDRNLKMFLEQDT